MHHHQAGLVILKICLAIRFHLSDHRVTWGPCISDFLEPVLPCGLASPSLHFEHNAKNYYQKYCELMGETLGIRKKLRGLSLEMYKDPGQK